MKTKLTKEQRKELAWEVYEKISDSVEKKYRKIKGLSEYEYKKITDPDWRAYKKIIDSAWEECMKKLEEIDNEPEEVEQIIEHKGHKYKLIEEKQ